MTLLIVFLSGLAIGGGLMWLVARARYQSEDGWTDKFKALAADTLRANNEAFLHLAESRLKQTEQAAASVFDKKTVAVEEMIKPVKESLQKMDAHEKGYERRRVQVVLENGEERNAITYVADSANGEDSPPPSAEYLQKILRGARQHGLPEGYIKEIEALANNGPLYRR